MNLAAIDKLKGIHPGIFLDHELKKRKLPKGRFALSINEYPQTLGAITNGKRDMNTALAMKIENELKLEEGLFMILQVFYDYKKIKESKLTKAKPDIAKFQKSTFWDTSIESIDWQKQKKAIVKRVFERGTEKEKKEISKFYGSKEVEKILNEL
jgi:plasmid maintenance system antidote protein VapI